MVYVDNMGNPKKNGGETDTDIVLRELPFQIGQLYNTEDGRRALRDIFALQLFDNVQVCVRGLFIFGSGCWLMVNGTS